MTDFTSFTSSGITFPNGTVQTTRSGLKSVQSIFASPKGTLTGDYGSSRAVNVTISAVNTGKSFIIYSSAANSTGNYSAPRMITAKFINSTTVQLCINTPYSAYGTRFQVVEFY